MVLSMLGICLAAGIAPEDAALLGNVAGGLEVEHVGVAVLSRAEIAADILQGHGRQRTKLIGADELTRRAEKIRGRGETIVFTNGCFDLLHVGHVTYLSEAAALGDHLVVAINSDASVSKIKGPARPVIRERDRAAMLEALECVDHVIIFDEDTPRDLLRAIRPDVLVKGGTYTKDQVVGHEIVESYGGRVVVAGIVDGVSTTRIVESVQRRAAHEHGGAEGRKDQAA
jgi:D-beta-D-heptose 7-phosphate kinase/D-beta-D-heptose 1-phosphate adenosyltransferase